MGKLAALAFLTGLTVYAYGLWEDEQKRRELDFT
ncbi:hypothetical protein ALCH109712_01415 [Alkalicoccus chagannorensis]